jgi:hypothetical protein
MLGNTAVRHFQLSALRILSGDLTAPFTRFGTYDRPPEICGMRLEL